MSGAGALGTRDGLPEALRELLAEYPRAGWEADPNFGGLVRFWMERHLGFRQLLAVLQSDGARLLARDLSQADFAARLSRHGRRLVGELEGHHQIEDHHYFPLLARCEPRLARGFDLLERDHAALDVQLGGFVQAANRVIGQVAAGEEALDAGAGLMAHLAGLERLLMRHLEDEEELVVPVILKHGEGGLG